MKSGNFPRSDKPKKKNEGGLGGGGGGRLQSAKPSGLDKDLATKGGWGEDAESSDGVDVCAPGASQPLGTSDKLLLELEVNEGGLR